MKHLVTTAVLGIGLLSTSVLHAEANSSIQTVVNGSAHEALYAVAFDGDKGIAVGLPGAISNTADGGKTWKLVDPAPTDLALLGVSLKGEHALAVGQQGLVLKREGETWKKADTGTDSRLFSVSVNSKGHAVAVGAFGTMLSSDDGGASWKSIAPKDWSAYVAEGEPSIYAASIDEANVITVAGEFGLILRSSNDGGAWASLHKGEASLFAMNLGDNGVGYAVGQEGTVLRSGDGGATWTQIDAGTKAILLGVHTAANQKVIVSGMREMRVSSDDGKTWTGVSGGDVNTAWYQGVGVPTGGTSVLAVGQSGRILRIGM